MSKCRAPPARESRPPPGVPIAANPNAEPLAPRRGGGGSGLAGVLALAGGYVAPPPNMVQVGASKSQLRSKLRGMIMVLTFASHPSHPLQWCLHRRTQLNLLERRSTGSWKRDLKRRGGAAPPAEGEVRRDNLIAKYFLRVSWDMWLLF